MSALSLPLLGAGSAVRVNTGTCKDYLQNSLVLGTLSYKSEQQLRDGHLGRRLASEPLIISMRE